MYRRIEVYNEATSEFVGPCAGVVASNIKNRHKPIKNRLTKLVSDLMGAYNLKPIWINGNNYRWYFTELGWNLCGERIEKVLEKEKVEYRVTEIQGFSQVLYEDNLQIAGVTP